jgi:integrase
MPFGINWRTGWGTGRVTSKRAGSTRALHRLTVREFQTAGEGDHADGGGLMLRVRGDGASWVLRFTSAAGRRREMGLGRAQRGSAKQAGDSLTGARELAHAAREQLRRGIDPIDARDANAEAAKRAEQAKKATAQRQRHTLARCARDYHERVIEPTRTVKHAAQWISSLENHVPSSIWNAPIDEIQAPALLAALLGAKPHERAHNHRGERLPETMRRLRQRLDSVFEDALFHGRCSSNPAAAIKRKMREGLARDAATPLRALPYREAPAFMQALRDEAGTAARCLELLVLTAARTSEALDLQTSELDLDRALWVVPAERMKAGEEHTVSLCDRAVELLRTQLALQLHRTIVFPSNMLEDRPLSNMALLAVLDRMGMRERTTVHGLRSTFSTWANETGAARPDVIEACLAHNERDKVRAAYNRAQFNDERRELMNAWAEFLMRPPAANVVPLRAA